MRITPDELHIQEQSVNTNYADTWIKGTKALVPKHHQSGRTTHGFQIRKRSISRVRSILQVEMHQMIRGLVEKHQVHRVLSSKIRPLFPRNGFPMIRIKPSEVTDLEDGHQSFPSVPRRSMFMPRAERHFRQESSRH